MPALVSLVVIMLSSGSAWCQPRHDLWLWSQVTTHIPLDDQRRFQLFLELLPRLADDVKRFDRLDIRSALNYNLDAQIALYLGYAWTPSFLDRELHHRFRNEQRIFEQVVVRHTFGRSLVQQRGRLEQRFIEGGDGASNRLRYQLKVSHPLGTTDRFGLVGFNEIFLTLNTTRNGTTAGYDRMRLFFGPFWLTGAVRYELGYLLEHAERSGGGERFGHAVCATVALNF